MLGRGGFGREVSLALERFEPVFRGFFRGLIRGALGSIED